MKIFKNLLKSDEVIMYTSSTCKYCTLVKDEFKKQKRKFTEKDILKNPKEWGNLVDLSNMPMTPAISYRGKNFFPGRDFPSPEILMKILDNFKQSDNEVTDKTYELILTLNHNINTAFGRLDQRLRQIEIKINKEEKDEHKSTD